MPGSSMRGASIATVLACTCSLSTGCRLAQMKLPASLADAPPMEVSRQGHILEERQLSFGPWSTPEVSRSLQRSFVGRLDDYEALKAEQSVSFSLARDGAVRVAAGCVTRLSRAQVEVFGVDVRSARQPMVCALTAPDGSKHVGTLIASMTGDYIGTLKLGRESYLVQGEKRDKEGGLPAPMPLGFVLSDATKAVGAVQVNPPQTIWLSSSLEGETRDAAAATLVALMLFRDLEDRHH